MKNGKKRRFKTKIKSTDESQLTGESIGDVIRNKINFVIDKVEIEKPYYIWLTKYQIIRGGSIFNSLVENHPTRLPLVGGYQKLSHLPGRQPTDVERSRMERLHYVSLIWPPHGLEDIIQDIFREMEDKINPSDSRIIMIPCRGYINKNNQLIDPSWNKSERWSSNKISGYVIYRQDEEAIKVINNYFMSPDTPYYEKLQMLRAQKTGPALRMVRIQASETMHSKALERRDFTIQSLKALKTDIPEPDWEKIRAVGPAVHNDLDE
jgi:hypothetical protein